MSDNVSTTDLRPFVLPNVRTTGRVIGTGAYGTVEEVEIPGAVCAAKKIHTALQDRFEISAAELRRSESQFVRECRLMSTLRHPHVVQFLGVCFLPDARLPALVMERLLTSLHDLLAPETEPPTALDFPLCLKRSVLHDVARGLAYLHERATPIIHRDLSARNVLLSSGMVAKIADMGVARIVPRLRAATMTKAPGAGVYMPPEALEDVSRYDVTIDIFSLGVVALFTLSQTFPCDLLAPTFPDEQTRQLRARSELERRERYMRKVHSQLRREHPLVQMITLCLKNIPEERPSIRQVGELLERARPEVQDEACDMNKLELVQMVRKRNEEIQSLQERVKAPEVIGMEVLLFSCPPSMPLLTLLPFPFSPPSPLHPFSPSFLSPSPLPPPYTPSHPPSFPLLPSLPPTPLLTLLPFPFSPPSPLHPFSPSFLPLLPSLPPTPLLTLLPFPFSLPPPPPSLQRGNAPPPLPPKPGPQRTTKELVMMQKVKPKHSIKAKSGPIRFRAARQAWKGEKVSVQADDVLGGWKGRQTT